MATILTDLQTAQNELTIAQNNLANDAAQNAIRQSNYQKAVDAKQDAVTALTPQS